MVGHGVVASARAACGLALTSIPVSGPVVRSVRHWCPTATVSPRTRTAPRSAGPSPRDQQAQLDHGLDQLELALRDPRLGNCRSGVLGRSRSPPVWGHDGTGSGRRRDDCREVIRNGDPTAWFEQLYADVTGRRLCPGIAGHPTRCWSRWSSSRASRSRTLVAGSGLGDDAAFLAARGYRVIAFDISNPPSNRHGGRFQRVLWTSGSPIC